MCSGVLLGAVDVCCVGAAMVDSTRHGRIVARVNEGAMVGAVMVVKVVVIMVEVAMAMANGSGDGEWRWWCGGRSVAGRWQ